MGILNDMAMLFTATFKLSCLFHVTAGCPSEPDWQVVTSHRATPHKKPCFNFYFTSIFTFGQANTADMFCVAIDSCKLSHLQ